MFKKVMSRLLPGRRTPYKRYCGAKSPDGKFFCVKRAGHDGYHRSPFVRHKKHKVRGYYAWGGFISGKPWFVVVTDAGDQGTAAQEE